MRLLDGWSSCHVRMRKYWGGGNQSLSWHLLGKLTSSSNLKQKPSIYSSDLGEEISSSQSTSRFCSLIWVRRFQPWRFWSEEREKRERRERRGGSKSEGSAPLWSREREREILFFEEERHTWEVNEIKRLLTLRFLSSSIAYMTSFWQCNDLESICHFVIGGGYHVLVPAWYPMAYKIFSIDEPSR